MEWNNDIDLSKRKMSSRLIVQRALDRGWRVCGFKSNPAVFLCYVPGRDRPISIFSTSPPQMSYPAAKIAKDKYITNQILGAAQLPVPKEILIKKPAETNQAEIQAFLEASGKVVIKPLDASHGKGISVNVDTMEKLAEALNEARKHSTNARILAQEQLEGVDVRAVCINYDFVDAISRLPAAVVGDGQNSIRELIEITNNSDERGENYKSRLNIIPYYQVERYMGLEAMKRIPKAGEQIQVIGVSNIGMGGIRLNVRDSLPDSLKSMAVQAARILQLPVCGVDFIVKKAPTLQDDLDTLQPKIIEVNECPMLTMYEDLHSPEQGKVIDLYLDYLVEH